MSSPFSFTGRIRPLPYALWSFGVFFSQNLIALLVPIAQGQPLTAVTNFGP